jgi:phenylacetate-CoA ligase
VGPDDVLQVCYTYGLFSGGLGLHYGAEKVGAAVVPASTGNTERQIDLVRDLNVTVIAATPSYLLHMGEVAEKMGVDIRKDTKLRLGILGAEPWSDRMRDRIFERLGIKAIDIYGTSELSGPLWCECSEQNGIHVWGDLTLVEVLDPKTGSQYRRGRRASWW